MKRMTATLILVALCAAPAAAQGRGRGKKSQGIPPGHMPPPGQCRVWYDGVPPGHQPAATSCSEAERVAARDRGARVIYGDYDGRNDRDNRGYGRNDRDRDRGITVPRDSSRYPNNPRTRYPDRSGYPAGGYQNVAFDKGYEDGLTKGRDDGRKNRPHDATRQSWYRSGDRGYNSRYGTKEEYKASYRDGFRRGYDEAYRNNGSVYNNR